MYMKGKAFLLKPIICLTSWTIACAILLNIYNVIPPKLLDNFPTIRHMFK